jgi:hypothetical protein
MTALPDPIPGTQPDKQCDFLYVEVLAGETALEHFRWMRKTYKAALKAGKISPPKWGLLGTTSWLIETPTGQMFYGLSVGGDREAWLSALRHCAQSAGRAAGQVIGYHRIPPRFALDDGRMFQLGECRCTKA